MQAWAQDQDKTAGCGLLPELWHRLHLSDGCWGFGGWRHLNLELPEFQKLQQDGSFFSKNNFLVPFCVCPGGLVRSGLGDWSRSAPVSSHFDDATKVGSFCPSLPGQAALSPHNEALGVRAELFMQWRGLWDKLPMSVQARRCFMGPGPA